MGLRLGLARRTLHADVARVLDAGADDDGQWLLTARIDATTAVAERWRAEPRATVRALGAAAAPPDALWAAWEAARVAEGWRTASLERDDLDASGARGRLADRRLDAVVALFAAAVALSVPADARRGRALPARPEETVP